MAARCGTACECLRPSVRGSALNSLPKNSSSLGQCNTRPNTILNFKIPNQASGIRRSSIPPFRMSCGRCGVNTVTMLSTEAPDAPVFLTRKIRDVMGVDLGQSSDPTAISVVEHRHGVLDWRSEHDRHCNIVDTDTRPQKRADQFNVLHLERVALGTSYPNVIQHVINLLARPPLCGDNKTQRADLVVDDSGVGRAVSDLMLERGLRPIRVSITAGSEITCTGPHRWNVSKSELVATVDALMHDGRLKFAAALTEAPNLKDELKDFRRKITDAGRSTYAARTGRHDDLILAIAIAAWWANRPNSYAQQGSYTWG